VRITPHDPPRLTLDEEAALRRLTRVAFGQRRKQFQRILRDAYALSPERIAEIEAATGFHLDARPETFSPADFIRLAAQLRS
jgi:16S rRNA A1518/A1519 N6-dimethyltransferase RsmA/KsgA/DIM1 with predicted DNA glycosylase/AP lyase activity